MNQNFAYSVLKISLIFFIAIFCLSTSYSQNYKDSLLIDTSANAIQIVGADSLTNVEGDVYKSKMIGNARFKQNDVKMRCDIAFFDQPNQLIDAVGNIIVNQGDSLFLYGDSMHYNGIDKIAYVFVGTSQHKEMSSILKEVKRFDGPDGWTYIIFKQN